MKRSFPVCCAFGLTMVFAMSGCVTSSSPPPGSRVEPRPPDDRFNTFHPPRETANTPSPSPGFEEATGALTLRQALALVLARNPELAAFAWDARIAEARRLQASLRPNPEAGVEVENVAGSGDFRGTREAETTLQLSQLIPLGGKRAKAMAAARFDRELAAWDYETARLDVLTRTAGDFIDTLARQEQVTQADELVRLAERVARAVSNRVQAARSSVVELTRAEVALHLARIDRDQARRALTGSRQRLCSNWGSADPRFELVAGNLRELPAVPSFNELERRLGRNPELARWAAEIERRRATLDLEKARAIPDVTVGAGYRRPGGSDDNAVVAGISIPLPLFDRNQGNIREAQYRLARAGDEQRATEVRLRTALTQAWQSFDAAKETLDALRTNVLPGARQTCETAGEYYQQGRFSLLEVLDAQRTLFTARSEEIDALRDCHQAVNEIARLVGEPLASSNRNFPEWNDPQP